MKTLYKIGGVGVLAWWLLDEDFIFGFLSLLAFAAIAGLVIWGILSWMEKMKCMDGLQVFLKVGSGTITLPPSSPIAIDFTEVFKRALSNQVTLRGGTVATAESGAKFVLEATITGGFHAEDEDYYSSMTSVYKFALKTENTIVTEGELTIDDKAPTSVRVTSDENDVGRTRTIEVPKRIRWGNSPGPRVKAIQELAEDTVFAIGLSPAVRKIVRNLRDAKKRGVA